MLIKYVGGRTWMKVRLNRGEPYIFTEKNNRELEINDQKVINYIFGLPNSNEFEAVVEKKEPVKKPESIKGPEKKTVKFKKEGK